MEASLFTRATGPTDSNVGTTRETCPRDKTKAVEDSAEACQEGLAGTSPCKARDEENEGEHLSLLEALYWRLAGREALPVVDVQGV